MAYLELIIVGLYSFIAAIVSRWHGGGFFKAPKIVKNMAWGTLLGVPTWAIYSWNGYDPTISISVGVAVTVLCGVLKATGHGGGIDVATNPKEPGNGRTVERLEYLILFLHDKINRRLYDTLLLVLTGVAAVLPAVIALGYIHLIIGFIVLIGGALKGLAYYFGWTVYGFKYRDGPKEWQSPTKIGELLTGAFMGLTVAIALFKQKLKKK